MSVTLISYYDQALSNALAPKYGDQLEVLLQVEKLQLIGAIALWMSDCASNPEINWASLGDYADYHGIVNEAFDAWDIVQNECNFTDPRFAMPLLKALVAQLDYGVWLKQ